MEHIDYLIENGKNVYIHPHFSEYKNMRRVSRKIIEALIKRVAFSVKYDDNGNPLFSESTVCTRRVKKFLARKTTLIIKELSSENDLVAKKAASKTQISRLMRTDTEDVTCYAGIIILTGIIILSHNNDALTFFKDVATILKDDKPIFSISQLLGEVLLVVEALYGNGGCSDIQRSLADFCIECIRKIDQHTFSEWKESDIRTISSWLPNVP